MIKIENGVEYLDYDQAAAEYGFSRNSIRSMVSRGVFISKKFPNVVNKYISRDELEAYKQNKNEIVEIKQQVSTISTKNNTIVDDTELVAKVSGLHNMYIKGDITKGEFAQRIIAASCTIVGYKVPDDIHTISGI